MLSFDKETVIICAARYAIEGKTFAAPSVIKEIDAVIPEISTKGLTQLEKIIGRAIEDRKPGDHNIEKLWVTCRRLVRVELRNRGVKNH
jgi:hypothetical protein